jgi:putative salt-induced outer membrane protein YdiY
MGSRQRAEAVVLTLVRNPIARSALAALAALLLSARPAPCETATVKLLNGDSVTGEVVERTPEHVVLQHPVLGRLDIAAAQIAPASTHPGILGTSILAGWDKDLTLGLTGSEGDTDEADLIVAFNLERRYERHYWDLNAKYAFGTSENEVDDHNARITALHDWLWPQSPWFAFVYAIYDYDKFEAWRHRPGIGTGPGYHLIKWPRFTLDTRVGPFVTYEFGEVDNARPELAMGLFAKWQFREDHSLSLTDVYFQTLDEAELRNVTRLEWKVRLIVSKGVSLKVGVDNEYDTASDESKNNLKYYTALAIDL